MIKDDLVQDIAGKTGIEKITKENSLILKEPFLYLCTL
jgi:hypothetical protein